MEKLNLKRDEKEFYILEVNDNGDTIKFDLMDIGLIDRIIKGAEKIENIDNEMIAKEKEIEEMHKDNEEMIVKLETQFELEKCLELRKVFDSFLGEGACQKIFGDTNRKEQFILLLEALEPHFEKMKILKNEAKKKLANKYLPKNDDVM